MKRKLHDRRVLHDARRSCIPSEFAIAVRGVANPERKRVAVEAVQQPWPTWLVNQERMRGRVMLMLLIPVSFVFLLTDFRFAGAERNLYIALRSSYVLLLVAALIALFRAKTPAVVHGLCGLGAFGVALFCCVRYGLGHGAAGVPGHLATDVVVMLALYMVPLHLLVQVLVAFLISVASAYGYLVWQGVEGAAATLLVLTLLLAHVLGFGGSVALRSSLRKRY